MKKLPSIPYHFAARASYPHTPFEDRENCVKAWRGLQRIFPDCFAAVLMPSHAQLIAAVSPKEVTELNARFKKLMRSLFARDLWDPISSPERVLDRKHLLRSVRYVHLNPCRDQLCRDPLEWEWSTHRDYLGATARPWPQTEKNLRALNFDPTPAGLKRFHQYVSSDPSVHPSGTPAPRTIDLTIGGLEKRAKPNPLVVLDLRAAELAAVRTLRCFPEDLRRKGRFRGELLRILARSFEVPPSRLAQHFQVSPAACRRDRPLASWSKALQITLSDPRLIEESLSRPGGSSRF